MRIAIFTYSIKQKEDGRIYDGANGFYINELHALGHSVFFAPDIHQEKTIDGFLHFVDALIFPPSDNIKRISLDSMEENPLDFQQEFRQNCWLKKAIEKNKPVLALGNQFFWINQYFGGKSSEYKAMAPGEIQFTKDFSEKIGVRKVQGMISHGKIITLGRDLEKLTTGERVGGLRKENLLAFPMYPEFLTKDKNEKILEYFSKSLNTML